MCLFIFFPPHLIQFRPDDVNAIKFYPDACKYLRAFYRETCREKFPRETHDGSRPKTLQVFKLFYDDDRGGAGQSYGGPPPRGRLHSPSALDNSSNSLVKARQYRNTIKYLYRPLTVHNRYSIHRVILLLLSTLITYEPPYLFGELMVFKKNCFPYDFEPTKRVIFLRIVFVAVIVRVFLILRHWQQRRFRSDRHNGGHCSSRSSYVSARNVEHVPGRLQTFGVL